jgi:hypothetical protein
MNQTNDQSSLAACALTPAGSPTSPVHEYRYLPLPAKCAIEYLDCQSERSIAKLDAYLAHYYQVYGQELTTDIRASCHHIAMRRFAISGEAATGAITGPTEATTALPIAQAAVREQMEGLAAGTTQRITYARVTKLPKHVLDPICEVWVGCAGGMPQLLFALEPGETEFPVEKLVGLTLEEAQALRKQSFVATA